jgi:cell division initiation protein
MKSSITPLELRKKTFNKRLRGYDRSEVDHFLEDLAEDLEAVWRRMDELEVENVRLKDEMARHRESEATLRDTLLLAQKSADGLREASARESERVIAEAEHQADRLVHQSLERTAEIEKRVRDLRVERKNFHIKLQGMLDMFQQVLNFDREDDELSANVSVMRSKAEKKREGEGA